MKKFFSSRKADIIFSAAAIVFMLLAWITAYYSVKNQYLVPSFSDSVKSLFECFAESKFYTAFAHTFLRTLSAFILSFLLAGACASLSVLSGKFKAFLKPVTVLFRTVPTLAVILLLLVWTSAKTAPQIVTFLVLFPIIYSQLTAAAEQIDGGLLQMAEVYGVSGRDRLFKIYLPQVSVPVFSEAGANMSLGLKVMISAEVMASTYKSIGGLMNSARAYLEMPRLAALTLITVALGLALDIALSQLKRINGRWYVGN